MSTKGYCKKKLVNTPDHRYWSRNRKCNAKQTKTFQFSQTENQNGFPKKWAFELGMNEKS